MNRPLALILGSVAVLVLLVMSLRGPDGSSERSLPGADAATDRQGGPPSILVYCAASNRGVMEAIRADYEKEFNVRIELQYGPSQTLLGSMQVSGTGDLYLPADASYLDVAGDKGLIDERIALASMQPVIAVAKGNPRQILQLDDLLRPEVRLVQANPDAAAIGTVTRRLLSQQGRWDELDAHTAAYRSTVTEVANDVKVGAADAAIVYDAVLHTYPDLQPVALPELADGTAAIEVAVLRSSKQPTRALHFARYLSAKDRGLRHYEAFGFAPVDGDRWVSAPELTVYAGSMLRPAIEQTIGEFEAREGARVTRVYNGCGILVAQMKAGQRPDAYFACDVEFMQQVSDLFDSPVDVSQNELVILVQKGNPHHIASLRDLTRPGLRVGVGHEKQCAMGWLTQQTLKEGRVHAEVMKNVTVQSPTGDMLVNQLKAGGLDAAVAYLSNAAGSGDVLSAVRIVGIPCAQAVQPFAVARDCDQQQLTTRLYQRLVAAESRERFLQEGFRWQADAAAGASTVAVGGSEGAGQ